MVMRNEASSLPALSHADALAANLSDFLLLFGRILIGWIFVRSGYGKIFDIAAYSTTYPGRGLPPMLAYIAVPVEFFGGLALVLGIATRYVTAIMMVFMLVATISSHRYWEFADANVRRVQDGNFWKNIAMMGGLFFLFVAGPGRFSVDGWLRGKR
jgi:putative oxidoreductase